MRKIFLTFSATILMSLTCTAASAQKAAKGCILFIGDGMGPAVVCATNIHLNGQKLKANGEPEKLSFEQFPVVGYMTTHSANSFITDSAAAGTAMACGVKTNNGVVGMDVDGKPYDSIAKIAADMGKSAGVLTSVFMNDATPSVFYAHSIQRANDKTGNAIIEQAFDKPFLSVLMGAGCRTTSITLEQLSEKAKAAGFTVANTKEDLDKIDAVKLGKENGRLFGDYDIPEPNKTKGNLQLDYETSRTSETKEPHLSELTRKAVEVVTQNPKGFFLMVEGGSIDWASHNGEDQIAIGETAELNKAVEQTVAYLKEKGLYDDTLIIVTADHDTGGFSLNKGYGKVFAPGDTVEMQPNTNGHTALPVMVWATGPGSELFAGKIDNTSIHYNIKKAFEQGK